MKVLSTFVVLSLFLVPVFSQPTRPPQEKVLLQNEYVTVYQITLKPGEKTPERTTGNRLIYSLSAYKLAYHWDNRTAAETRKPGDFHVHPSGSHAEENTGKTTASFLVAERTTVPLPPVEVSGVDMAKASPYNTMVRFDRELAKVFEVTLGPKDAVSMHLGLNRVVYALTPFELTVTTPDGKTVTERGKKGNLSWHTAGLHAVENRSKSTIRFLVFAFKH